MAVDSNMPYGRVNVQANNNDTIWNGAAWGAGAGVGALGLTYGATMHGAPGLTELNFKVAGNKTTRMETRNEKKIGKGKSHWSPQYLNDRQEAVRTRSYNVANAMGRVEDFGGHFFGSRNKAIATVATGLLGGMVAGAATDHFK